MSGKNFQFSLESVLRLRKHETESARRQLERVATMRATAEAVMEEAERILYENVHRPVNTGTLGPSAFRRHNSFREEARMRLEAARVRVAELKRAEEEARSRLVERRRDEESLEQLYDEEHSVHRATQEAADAAFLDEQAITGYNRQRVARA
jgi:flagellar protein FliJ